MDPHNAQEGKSVFRLEGNRRERIRRHMALSEDQLMVLADAVLPPIGVDPEETMAILVHRNNTTIVFYGKDGKCVGEYRDPPGECTSECSADPISPM